MNDKCKQDDSRNSWQKVFDRGTLLQMILETSQDGINVCRWIDGRRELVACNDRYVEMSGRTREQLMAEENITALETDISLPENSDERLAKGETLHGVKSWNRPDDAEN